MRRLLAALLVACGMTVWVGAAGAWWQSVQQVSVVTFTPSCTESSNFFTRAADLTLVADKTNYDTLICGLVSDGFTSTTLPALYIWATTSAGTRSVAKLNLMQNAFNLTEIGTVNFTAYRGYTGNGSGAADFALDSGYNPNTSGTAASAGIGVYDLSNQTGGGNIVFFGAQFVGTTILKARQFGNGNGQINDGLAVTASSGGSNGFWALTVTGGNNVLYNWSSANSFAGLMDTQLNAVPNLPQESIYFFATHGGGTPANFTDDEMSGAYISQGLSSANALALARRFNTFMSAYSISQYTQP